MHQPSPALYHKHYNSYCQQKWSSAAEGILPTLLSSNLAQPETETLDLSHHRGAYYNTAEPDPNGYNLSVDEKLLLQKAEQKEKDYHREIQMTTLINSRFVAVHI